VGSPEEINDLAGLMQRYPDRFLFGSDSPAPMDQATYLKVFRQYEQLWESPRSGNVPQSAIAELRAPL
jgi:hypothetical protein